MDPISQGLLGAAAGYAVGNRSLGRSAALVGACAGMAPDLDILIYSSTNPTTGWLFHRHFTHALVFVPAGAALTALIFSVLARFRKSWRAVLVTAVVGMGTHAALDIFTSYGTLWFWPFSMKRVALDYVSVVDPIYTGVLFLAVTAALVWRWPRIALTGITLSSAYLLLGGWQHHRAMEAQALIADARNHRLERGRVVPMLGSQIVWRSIYEFQGTLYVDGFRVPWRGDITHQTGGAARRLERTSSAPVSTRLLMSAPPPDVLDWFADGWIGEAAGYANTVADFRYALDPTSLVPLWGLETHDDGVSWVRWSPPRTPEVARSWRLITQGDPAHVALKESVRQIRANH